MLHLKSTKSPFAWAGRPLPAACVGLHHQSVTMLQCPGWQGCIQKSGVKQLFFDYATYHCKNLAPKPLTTKKAKELLISRVCNLLLFVAPSKNGYSVTCLVTNGCPEALLAPASYDVKNMFSCTFFCVMPCVCPTTQMIAYWPLPSSLHRYS